MPHPRPYPRPHPSPHRHSRASPHANTGCSALPVAALALALALTLLAGCANAPAPTPPQLFRLPLTLPAMVSGQSVPADASPAAPVWQVVYPVGLPELLDRDSLLLPQAGTGVLRASGQRWAEPLRDAVPRLLLFDLAQLRGAASVFASPLPPGVVVAQQLRVQLLALEAAPDRRSVHLQARWSLADPQGNLAPTVGQVRLDIPTDNDQPDALVAAHRLALWQMAQQLAQQVGRQAGQPVASPL